MSLISWSSLLLVCLSNQGMSVFCSTITECWDHDPEARLTAHCVVERFNALQQEEEGGGQEEEEEEGLRREADGEEDGEREKDSETPDKDQIPLTGASSPCPPFQSPQSDSKRGGTAVSHDSLVHTGSAV